MEENKMNGVGFGTTSLVTGILSILFIQFIVISIIFAIAAIIFGVWYYMTNNQTDSMVHGTLV